MITIFKTGVIREAKKEYKHKYEQSAPYGLIEGYLAEYIDELKTGYERQGFDVDIRDTHKTDPSIALKADNDPFEKQAINYIPTFWQWFGPTR